MRGRHLKPKRHPFLDVLLGFPTHGQDKLLDDPPPLAKQDQVAAMLRGGVLIAPKAILPPGFVLPSTAPIPENPQATWEKL